MTDDALDLGMLGISGDQYQGILRLVSDDFLNLANIRAGGIYIGDAVFFERFIDAVRYAVGADDDRDLFGLSSTTCGLWMISPRVYSFGDSVRQLSSSCR